MSIDHNVNRTIKFLIFMRDIVGYLNVRIIKICLVGSFSWLSSVSSLPLSLVIDKLLPLIKLNHLNGLILLEESCSVISKSPLPLLSLSWVSSWPLPCSKWEVSIKLEGTSSTNFLSSGPSWS